MHLEKCKIFLLPMLLLCFRYHTNDRPTLCFVHVLHKLDCHIEIVSEQDTVAGTEYIGFLA